MTYNARSSAHAQEYQHDRTVTVLMNLHIRATVIPDLVVNYDVCDCSAAVHIGTLVGGGGRAVEGHTSELGDIHHGLMKMITGGSMEGAYDLAEWELGEWVHH